VTAPDDLCQNPSHTGHRFAMTGECMVWGTAHSPWPGTILGHSSGLTCPDCHPQPVPELDERCHAHNDVWNVNGRVI
jgi:hypothetical protein